MSFRVELTDHTALVTGGTRNIGLDIAKALKSAGARVCVVGRSDEAALEHALAELRSTSSGAADSPNVMGVLADVGSESAVTELFDRIEAQLSPVTVLVNAAASRPHAPIVDLSVAEWSSVIDTILTGAFLTSRELFRRLPAGRHASIINVGGLTAHRPAKDRMHVIAAKAGLIGLSRALAEEGRGRVRVNAVVPGRIDTVRRSGQTNPNVDETEPLGTSRDVSRAVLAFADPRDLYVTGQTVHVSGGRFMP